VARSRELQEPPVPSVELEAEPGGLLVLARAVDPHGLPREKERPRVVGQPHSGDIVEGAVLGLGHDLSAAARRKLVRRMGHLRIIRGPEA
jgi:hypothetical protein